MIQWQECRQSHECCVGIDSQGGKVQARQINVIQTTLSQTILSKCQRVRVCCKIVYTSLCLYHANSDIVSQHKCGEMKQIGWEH
jgi:hypothetical protein